MKDGQLEAYNLHTHTYILTYISIYIQHYQTLKFIIYSNINRDDKIVFSYTNYEKVIATGFLKTIL